jgi:hypothetical protein
MTTRRRTRRPIHVVVACSQTKRQAAPLALHLSQVRGRSVSERASRWLERLQNARASADARELYGGPYWAGVRRVEDKLEAAKRSGRVWVSSAGYGLISAGTPVSAYNATFARGSDDSVLAGIGANDTTDALQEWWAVIAGWAGPHSAAAPRTLTDLLLGDLNSAVLVVAGPNYVRAMADDLSNAIAAAGVDRVAVISPGLSHKSTWLGSVRSCLLRAGAEWEHRVGAGKTTLGIRVAEQLLQHAQFSADNLATARNQLERLGRRLPDPVTHDRTTVTDDAVNRFIKQRLRQDPAASFTQLLRAFRDKGFACEYKRFRSLFHLLRPA